MQQLYGDLLVRAADAFALRGRLVSFASLARPEPRRSFVADTFAVRSVERLPLHGLNHV
jgi:hypothetical protein